MFMNTFTFPVSERRNLNGPRKRASTGGLPLGARARGAGKDYSAIDLSATFICNRQFSCATVAVFVIGCIAGRRRRRAPG